MKSQFGEIHVAPRKVFWFFMSPHLDERFRIQMLKKDLFVSACTVKEIAELKEAHTDECMYLFNLDGFLMSVRAPNNLRDQFLYAQKLAHIVKGFVPSRSIIHTSIIDPHFNDYFRQKQLLFLSKNLSDSRLAAPALSNIASKLLYNGGKGKRTHLRVQAYPENQIQFEMQVVGRHSPRIKGYIKDFSINGLGLHFESEEALQYIKLKDFVKVRIYMTGGNINVAKAMIVRIAGDATEAGLFFNMDDDTMISEDDSFALTNIIHTWLETVMNRVGKTAELNELKVAH